MKEAKVVARQVGKARELRAGRFQKNQCFGFASSNRLPKMYQGAIAGPRAILIKMANWGERSVDPQLANKRNNGVMGRLIWQSARGQATTTINTNLRTNHAHRIGVTEDEPPWPNNFPVPASSWQKCLRADDGRLVPGRLWCRGRDVGGD